MTTRSPEVTSAIKHAWKCYTLMRDTDDKEYFRKCLAGWRREIKKLKAKG